jgi:hypothetical protein
MYCNLTLIINKFGITKEIEINQEKNFLSTKGRGFFYTNYSYMTLFVRNAAYLTHLQLKALRFRNGNKSFDF